MVGFSPIDILLLTQAPTFVWFDGTIIVYYYYSTLLTMYYNVSSKNNQNAPRPSEHPPVGGEKMSKRLGGIKGCKYKTSSWHLNGFPDGNNIGQQYNVGEKPTVILYITLTAMQRHQENSKNKTETMYYTITHGSNNILLHRL